MCNDCTCPAGIEQMQKQLEFRFETSMCCACWDCASCVILSRYSACVRQLALYHMYDCRLLSPLQFACTPERTATMAPLARNAQHVHLCRTGSVGTMLRSRFSAVRASSTIAQAVIPNHGVVAAGVVLSGLVHHGFMHLQVNAARKKYVLSVVICALTGVNVRWAASTGCV